MATTESAWYKLIKKHYEDTQALEMESIGFAESMQEFPGIRYLNIRSISDSANDKAEKDRAGGQRIAAAHAAAFTFELIHELTEEQLQKPFMKIDDLAGEIFAVLRPLIKPGPAFPNIYQTALLNRIQTYIGADWAVIKDKTPAWKYAEGHFVGALSRGLDQQEAIIKELENLLEKAKLLGLYTKKNMLDESKIVVQKGDIKTRTQYQIETQFSTQNQSRDNVGGNKTEQTINGSTGIAGTNINIHSNNFSQGDQHIESS